jgi:hypothetical protein
MGTLYSFFNGKSKAEAGVSYQLYYSGLAVMTAIKAGLKSNIIGLNGGLKR